MKRTLATALLLTFSTAALAQAPEPLWRSPFTPAPSLSGVSPMTAESNRKAREQDQAAWAARRAATAQSDRPGPSAQAPKKIK
jgi:hypothetical protein